MAFGLFLFFAASAAADAATVPEAAAVAANVTAADAEANLQYLQAVGIRSRDFANAFRCATL